MMRSAGRQVFYGETMAQAMIAMKGALGHDAVLINSRKVTRGGVFGIGAKQYYEVEGEVLPAWMTAEQKGPERSGGASSLSSAETIQKVIQAAGRIRNSRVREEGWVSNEVVKLLPSDTAASGPSAVAYGRTGRRPSQRPPEPLVDEAPRFSPRRPEASAPSLESHALTSVVRQAGSRRKAVTAVEIDDRILSLRAELEEFKREIKTLITVGPEKDAEFDEAFAAYYRHLRSVGVDEELSRSIVDRVASRTSDEEKDDETVVRSRIVKEIGQRIVTAPPLEPDPDVPTIIAVVGATGVGKTTTLAKLGWMLSDEEARRVAYVTLDYYRIGGADQLRTYADILGVELEEASGPQGLDEAISRHHDKEFILVDTAGRSPRSRDSLDELRTVLQELRIEPELLLFVSATTSGPEMDEIIRSFSISENARLVFTKVDEASRWGALYSAAVRSRIPVAYLTTGQEVPYDIEPAMTQRIAEALLEGFEA